jgi:hypothetical protein
LGNSSLPSVAAVYTNNNAYVYVAWQDDRDNPGVKEKIWSARSTNNGTSWISEAAISGGTSYSLGPCVAASGAYVNVAWHDYRTGKWNIYDQRSTDYGGTWKTSDDYLTNNTIGCTELPNLAASGANVYGVWDGSSSGDFEIDCDNSTDYGASWVLDRRLTNSNGCSEYPSVAVSGTGVHVVWQDNRDGNYEIYYKRCLNPLSLGWFQKPASTYEFRAYSWLTYNSGSGSIYAAHGYADGSAFDRYNIQGGDWASRHTWYPQGAGSCASADGTSYVYAAVGGSIIFYRFAVDSNLWNRMADVLSAVGAGGSCVYVPTGTGYVYLMTGTSGSSCKLYRYSVNGDTWTEMTGNGAPPDQSNWGAGSWLAYDNVNKLAYALAATSNHLYKYDVKGDSWFTPTLASMPVMPGVGGCGVFLNGRIYALRGNGTNEFYSYNIAANGWTRLEDAPTPSGDATNAGDGASITTNGQDVYMEKGNSSKRLYQYVPGGAVFGPAPPVEHVVARSYVCDKSFAIAPNPLVSGFATLSFARPLDHWTARPLVLSIYNVSGQSVLNRTLAVGSEASSVTLDLRHLSNGVYLARLTGDGFAGTQKLVVRR